MFSLWFMSLLTYSSSFSQGKKLRIVGSNEFEFVLDSLKTTKGTEYCIKSTVCRELSRDDEKDIINSLAQGYHPNYGDKEISSFSSCAFGPGKASVSSDNVILCFSDADDIYWGSAQSVRIISGDLQLNPWQKIARREALIGVGIDFTANQDLQEKSCYFYWLSDTVMVNGSFVHYEKALIVCV